MADLHLRTVHAGHPHENTPAARAKCRRDHGKNPGKGAHFDGPKFKPEAKSTAVADTPQTRTVAKKSAPSLATRRTSASGSGSSGIDITGGTPDHQRRFREILDVAMTGVPAAVISRPSRIGRRPLTFEITDDMTGRQVGGYSAGENKLRIRRSVLANADDPITRSMNNSSKIGWWSKSDLPPLTHVMTHEFGHFLHEQTLSGEQEVQMIRDVLKSWGVSDPIEDRLSARGVLLNNKAAIVANVGAYAATSLEEMVAELWAEFKGRGDKASEAAKIVGRNLLNGKIKRR